MLFTLEYVKTGIIVNNRKATVGVPGEIKIHDFGA